MPERLTWDEMLEKYPGHWLVLGNVEFDRGSSYDIASADVIEVLSEYEALDKIAEYRYSRKPYIYRLMQTQNTYTGIVECWC